MTNKRTDELLKILHQSTDINTYLKDNDTHITDIEFHDYLNQLLSERNLTKSSVINASNIQKNYGYQIFDGSKKPSRDKVLALALAMSLTLEDTNRLLHLSNNGILYPKLKRDSIIIFAIEKNYKLIYLNIMLDEMGEKPIE